MNDLVLSRAAFTDWMSRYKRAWEHFEIELIETMFAPDAAYYETPLQGPDRGLKHILAYWKDAFKQQEDVAFDFEVLHTSDHVGFAKWQARFVRQTNGAQVALDGICEVQFNADLMCTCFREWWHKNETQ